MLGEPAAGLRVNTRIGHSCTRKYEHVIELVNKETHTHQHWISCGASRNASKELFALYTKID